MIHIANSVYNRLLQNIKTNLTMKLSPLYASCTTRLTGYNIKPGYDARYNKNNK